MKPASFEYFAPETVDDVVGVLTEWGEDAKILAGGQSLVPMLNMRLTRFGALVDIGRVAALRDAEFGGSSVSVGAMVTQGSIERDGKTAKAVPLLAKATPLIGHFQIRSRGTVGGSLVHADPAAEYPAVALALDAEMELVGPDGRRVVHASDFFTGTWSTATGEAELLTAVRFPVWGRRSGFAVEEVARRHGDFALAGACVAVELTGGTVSRCAFSFFGVGSTPIRSEKAEQAITGAQPGDIVADEIGLLAVADLDPPADLHASSSLRRCIAAEAAARALRSAIEEADSHE